MFEVLAFVYENYWRGDVCPARPALQRKLNAVGFDDTEIQLALVWLDELRNATHQLPANLATQAPSQGELQADRSDTGRAAARVLTAAEQARLGRTGWGFLIFLGSVGVLTQERFELVMDRAMAATADELCEDDLKLIVLMVFWSLGEEPEALVLDELCDNRATRTSH